MEWLIPLTVILGSFAALMFLGFPIGVAFLLVAFVGSAVTMGVAALPSFALSCF